VDHHGPAAAPAARAVVVVGAGARRGGAVGHELSAAAHRGRDQGDQTAAVAPCRSRAVVLIPGAAAPAQEELAGRIVPERAPAEPADLATEVGAPVPGPGAYHEGVGRPELAPGLGEGIAAPPAPGRGGEMVAVLAKARI